ncbi:MAG: amino acid adenylation domain-containing protein, partial [Bacteroidota bacterium]
MKTVTSKIITNYWYGKIKGVVPFDLTVPASFRDEEIVVPAGELAYFEKVTSGEELPKFTVLLTVFSILLRRYFEEANLLCCTTRLIGEDRPTLTTIPSIDGKTLKTCLQELKQEVQDIHKYTNKEGWDDALPPLSSYAPFCFQYGSTFSLPDAPFSIAITSQDGALKIKAQFDQNFTDSVTINHLLGNFRNWLRDMDRLLDTELVSVPLISEEEKEQLLITFNPTELQVSDSSLVDLFKEQVQQNPEKVAVLYNEIALTYAELDRLSSQLAQYLVSRYEIQAGDLIGVKLERNQWLVVGILATLKAGAAYVPIDVAYPQERIDYIEKDSGCKFVVNDEIIIDCQKQLAGEITDIGETITSSQIAYIIYTSGSTGAPKGVSITQRNAVHLIEWAKTEFDLNSFETIYAATSHCFDLSIFEMFFTLSTGKTIRLFKNALDIPQYIQRDESILLNTVPSSMRTLLEENMDLGHVTAINLAGEPLPLDLAKLLLQWPLELRNLYGPSEDTTYSTCYRVTHTNFTSVPIGSPIAGTRGYVLDRWGQLCPVGVAGTLFLAGDGVAKGYLHRPELTAQMFVEDPFYDGSVMYNTGDLVKWSVDGTLQFLGRKDNQVKLRGYRIELEEVENAIRAYSEEISQAVVVVREHQATQVLVAYVVAEEPLDVNQMRAFLHGQLPDYMVPNFFQELKEIPMTLNGKIDRKSLPTLVPIHSTSEQYQAPTSEIEWKLKAIWEEVLGMSPIGIKDHFFELGGHSLMITQIINRVYRALGKQVTVKDFYKHPTIEGLAKHFRLQNYQSIPKAKVQDTYPATPSQNRIWLSHQLEGFGSAHVIAGALRVKGKLDIDALQQAFQRMVARHDALRTVFVMNELGELQQKVLAPNELDIALHFEDVSRTAKQGPQRDDVIEDLLHTHFDLTQGPLLRASLLKEKQGGRGPPRAEVRRPHRHRRRSRRRWRGGELP